METLIAKQPEGYLTEAEAIMQAKDGVAAAFGNLYKTSLPMRIQPLLLHD